MGLLDPRWRIQCVFPGRSLKELCVFPVRSSAWIRIARARGRLSKAMATPRNIASPMSLVQVRTRAAISSRLPIICFNLLLPITAAERPTGWLPDMRISPIRISPGRLSLVVSFATPIRLRPFQEQRMNTQQHRSSTYPSAAAGAMAPSMLIFDTQAPRTLLILPGWNLPLATASASNAT